MTAAHITRLMTFAQHGQPVGYAASDMMRADLEALIRDRKLRDGVVTVTELEPDPGQKWKCGDEFLPFHPSASHVPPEYRDGWNRCYWMAVARQSTQAQHTESSAPGAAVLYEHEDGRYAAAVGGEAAFTDDDPKWHRLGPVTLIGRPAAWPIVKVTVKHGNVQTASLYAPGLPDGEYDLWLPESRAAREGASFEAIADELDWTGYRREWARAGWDRAREGALPDDKDAARYRWLRADHDSVTMREIVEAMYLLDEAFDAAIDAAMSATGALK